MLQILGKGSDMCRGSAVAKITAENLKLHNELFHPVLNLWVHEEIVNGEKLSYIINSRKENVKYAFLV